MLHWFAKRLHELHKKDRKGEKGFTLIELLVVIIIIGILAAIAIPAFLAQRDRARVATVESDLRNASQAATACAADNGGSYATCNTVAQLQAYDFNPTPSVNWGGASFAGTTATVFDVQSVSHNDNASIIGQFNSDSGLVTVTS